MPPEDPHLRAVLEERPGGHGETIRAAAELGGLAQDPQRPRLAALPLLLLVIAEPGQQFVCGLNRGTGTDKHSED